MKWVLYAAGGIGFLVVVILVVGYVLPQSHTASVRAHYRQPPQSLYDAIVDVEHGPDWRTGLDSVRIIERTPLTWQESASWGKLTMVMAEATPPARVVSRIADESEGFGGTWTYEIAPDANGSVVVITERGEVYSPLFRFMSKFIVGHYKSLETYAKDLGTKFDEVVEPERVAD